MEEILEAVTQTATIEQVEMSIKTEVEMEATSASHCNSEIDVNCMQQDPVLLHSIKTELSVTADALVKEEILVDGSHDDSKQQCVYGPSTSAGTGSMNEVCRMRLSDLLNVKYESAEMDIGPTVLQHMDTHYTINKNMRTTVEENTIFDDCNEAMPGSGVRKGSIEDKRRDNKMTSRTYWAPMTKEDDFDEGHLESCLGQRKDFQRQLLHQHGATSASGSESSNIYHKPHLLSASNKLQHARFAQKGNLKHHMTVHTGEKPYQCNKCEAKFTLKSNLTQHMRLHTGEKPYQCCNCDARFAQKGALNVHTRVHTGEKHYQCNNCDARFAHKSTLNSHMKVHTGEKPYQCTKCDARFAQRSTLNGHMRIHTGKKPHQCSNCDARFGHKATLNSHMKIHTGEKPYQCKKCGAKFAMKSSLTQHMTLHTGEKPYQCGNCDARFAQKGTLRTHMRVHTGEKPYQCNKCDAKFTLKCNLTQHMRLHTGEKPYRCSNCDARFAQKGHFRRHMRVHTVKK